MTFLLSRPLLTPACDNYAYSVSLTELPLQFVFIARIL